MSNHQMVAYLAGIIDGKGINPARLGFKLAAKIINCKLARICSSGFTGKPLEVMIKARGIKLALPVFCGDGSIHHPYTREQMLWAVMKVNSGEFSDLRDALNNVENLTLDNTDGISIAIDYKNSISLNGCLIAKAYQVANWQGSEMSFIQGPGGRSYHSRNLCNNTSDAKALIREAVLAWRKQDNSKKGILKTWPHLTLANVTILVTKEDSYAVGNCNIGTISWLNVHGIGTVRTYVPVSMLIPHANDERVASILGRVQGLAKDLLTRQAA